VGIGAKNNAWSHAACPTHSAAHLEYVKIERLNDGCFRLKAGYRSRKRANKLQYACAQGYSTDEEAAAEADIFGYSVLKELAYYWVSFSQRESCSDLSRHIEYSTDFKQATATVPTPASKRPISIVSPPSLPLNAAQSSQFKKLKSCDPSFSKREYF
jgi:hypothetical protein